MSKIIFVVTSNNRLGNTGRSTGLWLEELASPYFVFRSAGLTIDIASPSGGAAPIDELSLSSPWLSEEGNRFINDRAVTAQLQNTLRLDDVDANAYDSVFFVGGLGAAWDFFPSEAARSVTETIFNNSGIVSGVCHGVLGLTNARAAGRENLLKGAAVTAVSNEEERMLGVAEIVPVLPEDLLKSLGSKYSCAAPLDRHVVVDGRIMTGQNPASAAPLARAVLVGLGCS